MNDLQNQRKKMAYSAKAMVYYLLIFRYDYDK